MGGRAALGLASMISASQVLQGAYAGAEEAGYRVLGLCTVDSETVLAGPKDAPVEIGSRVTLTIREAENGRLLPRREDSGPGDPPARWLLKIDVYPIVDFDADAEGRVAWVAHARRLDVASGRVVGVGMSGLSWKDRAVLLDDRPVHEYLEDPVYEEAIRGAEATDPTAAVAEAMRRLPPPPVVTPGRQRKTLIAVGIVTVGVGIGLAAFLGSNDTAPAPTGSSATGSSEPEPTSAGTVTSEPTAGLEPLKISTGTVLVYEGTQDSMQTWDVGGATLVNEGTLADSLQFYLVTTTPDDDNSSMLALASPPECASETGANCGWVLEVYEHVGTEQHSSAAELGTVPLGIENTFLSENYDQGTQVDVAEECNASVTSGKLPVHPTDADNVGIGVYFPNADSNGLTDTVFVELGPPTEAQVIVVEHGDSTAIAIASEDATLAGCFSSSGMSSETFMDTLDPALCEAEELESGIEYCGEPLDWVEFAEVLRAQSPTPEIEEMLRQIEVGNIVGISDEVGLIADALALYSLLTE